MLGEGKSFGGHWIYCKPPNFRHFPRLQRVENTMTFFGGERGSFLFLYYFFLSFLILSRLSFCLPWKYNFPASHTCSVVGSLFSRCYQKFWHATAWKCVVVLLSVLPAANEKQFFFGGRGGKKLSIIHLFSKKTSQFLPKNRNHRSFGLGVDTHL